MSQENVENLRAVLEAWDPEAWRRGEFDTSLLDPQVIYEDKNLPDHTQEAYRGHEGVIRATKRFEAESPYPLASLMPRDRLKPLDQAMGAAGFEPATSRV